MSGRLHGSKNSLKFTVVFIRPTFFKVNGIRETRIRPFFFFFFFGNTRMKSKLLGSDKIEESKLFLITHLFSNVLDQYIKIILYSLFVPIKQHRLGPIQCLDGLMDFKTAQFKGYSDGPVVIISF